MAGFSKPLYILPFDHRGSFQTKMFGWKGTLTAAQTAEIAAAKEVIYDGFKAAVTGGVPKDRAGILVDEQFGAAILKDAAKNGYYTACPAEKSGQDEFDFEYGADFGQHIEMFKPTFCKVLVRYNPEADKAMNQRQTSRLKQLSDYLHKTGRLFMFELLVPAEPAQLERVKGDKKMFDVEVRPGLMVQSIHAIQDVGIEPDVWKIEGLDRREDCAKVVAAARRARQRRLHRPGPRRGRQEGARMARRRRQGAGLYRLCGWSNDLLGSAGCVPGQNPRARRSSQARRGVLPGVGESV